MHRLARLLIVIATALSIWPVPAAAQTPLTRTQALAALEHAAAHDRATAVARLAQIGLMADAERVARRLHDDDDRVRELANLAMWQIWGRSGDRAIDALFERGVAQMEADNMPDALGTFDEIVRRRPAFAEGWNKRATVLFLLERFDDSLRDCHEVLKRNPLHYGAMSGMGQIHLQRGDADAAVRHFERALQVNPNQPGVSEALRLIRQQRANPPRIST